MSWAIGQAYDIMTSDMRGKLHGYQQSLEHRYGDPRVYAMQREQMAADQAEIIYSEAKTREQALASAYQKNRQQTQVDHRSRLERFARDKPPQFSEVHQNGFADQTVEPDSHPVAGRSGARSARTEATAR